ncbi:VTT domain-containing protein [Candidatus Collierbacteria bacterium]|nr:VTT domain-containing protein [Candidatus Collierbacteria bacterium]
MKIRKRNYFPVFFITITFLAMIIIGSRVPESKIRQIMESAGPWGVVLLIFCLWTTNVVAPLSGSPFLFAGFYLYGQMSVFYAFIAAVIASITNFLIGKIWGRKAVVMLAGVDGLNKIDELTKDYGLQALFVFRLFMKEFHDVISYAFGLTNLKFSRYFIVSTLGMIPATIVWYLISLKITSALTFTTISWIFAYTSGTVYFCWVKFGRNWVKNYFLRK